jgi:two-component system sensor histidine kinase/response regulator
VGTRELTVLVVDVCDDTRGLIRHVFVEPEARVLEASDGASGLDLARAAPPDCVLLGPAAPQLDPLELLARLRQEPATREIPVLVLTAGEDEAADRALQIGAVDYITLPASPERIGARVRGAVERRRLLGDMREMQGTMASMLVHDLRSPLSVIAGYLQLLEFSPTPLAPQHRRYLTSIREGCAAMTRLIGEVLDLTRIEAGTLAVQPEPVDATALATRVVEPLRMAAQAQSLALEVQAPGPLTVQADPGRLEQILRILLAHALKFTPPSGWITVSLAPEGEGVEIAVRHSGPGIELEELRSLLERVARTSAGSSGLGLVLARRLVEAHGGRLRAEREGDTGSRLVLSLPRAGP